jgi:hypothetical protein
VAQQLLNVLPLPIVFWVGEKDLVQVAGIIGVSMGDSAAFRAGCGQLLHQDFSVVKADVQPAVCKHRALGSVVTDPEHLPQYPKTKPEQRALGDALASTMLHEQASSSRVKEIQEVLHILSPC